jgi:hypothetical protein
MEPLATIKRAVMMRVRRDTFFALTTLARESGLRPGTFAAHIMESIVQCPPERLHSAMAAFLDEARRKR